MGASEIAALLGWLLTKVTKYDAVRGAGFPEPWLRLKRGRVWLRRDVEAWAYGRGYLPRQTSKDADQTSKEGDTHVRDDGDPVG